MTNRLKSRSQALSSPNDLQLYCRILVDSEHIQCYFEDYLLGKESMCCLLIHQNCVRLQREEAAEAGAKDTPLWQRSVDSVV